MKCISLLYKGQILQAFDCHALLIDFFCDEMLLLVQLQRVYDKDTFSLDDKMGDAEFDISQFIEVVKMRLDNLPSGTIIRKIQPSRENCLAEESCIVWANGKVVQNVFLRLKHVETGEVELQLEWIDIPGSRGL
jgi:hypothetical protein